VVFPVGIEEGLTAAVRIVDTVGRDRIGAVTLTRGRITLQPTVLAGGEAIARTLGLDFPVDHRMLVPGYTLWSGERDGLEVQVRAALRTRVGAAW
jgi:hypothetical protein